MYRQAVTSTTIASIGYDPHKLVLEVEFCSGNVYQYLQVPKRVYNEFMNAPSKGRFLTYEIKDHYSYKEIS